MTTPDPLEKICPLCGSDNQCAVAAGRPPESCWCQGVTLDPDALHRVPAESIDRYCICPDCGNVNLETTREG